MKPYNSIAAATVVAAALAISIAAAQAGSTPAPIDPGFNPQTGQINPGDAPHPWSAAAELPQDKPPPQEQARAALMLPDPVGVPSLGEAPAQGGNQSTTGIAAQPADQAGAPAAPPGPIGATLQTMPAKFSQRNDLLDHLPTMSWPLPLNEQQRQQIYQAVMADKTPQPATGADTLKPAVFLSYAQTRDVRPLPPSLSGIDGLQGLQYIKAKDKVLLVRPPNGIVVDQITM